ncbi:MAG: molybdopterin-dependent oxidoreductase, partial [Alphaproteobacteria bacterium]|nr:molybdopterin-dependent oxidoreductase [Alphaproteobacteria bacterium]
MNGNRINSSQRRLHFTRRKLLIGGSVTSGLLLTGCEKIGGSATGTSILDTGEKLTYNVQRSLSSRMALAPEFRPDQMSPRFRSNGNTMPASADYATQLAQNFVNWVLRVDGLVDTPLDLSLADLREMPTRSQITAHNCVEGWTAIAKWTGVPLSFILQRANVRSSAKYIVFHCADDFGGTAYYES